MVREISGASRVLSVYDRQQFYADRTVELKIPKTVQIGATDRVTLSPDAQAMRAAMTPTAASQTVAANPASVFMYHQPVAKQLTYDDPRRAVSHSAQDETARVETAEPDSDKDDSEFVSGIAAGGETEGGASTTPR